LFKLTTLTQNSTLLYYSVEPDVGMHPY